MSLADEIIKEVHDIIPDQYEEMIPDAVMSAVDQKIEDLAGKLPDNVENILEVAGKLADAVKSTEGK